MKRNKKSQRGGAGLRVSVYTSVIFLSLFLSYLLICPYLAHLAAESQTEEGFLKAVRLDPDNAAYYHDLGRYYQFNLFQPDIKKAISFYEKALRLNPMSVSSLLDLARAYQFIGEKARAEMVMGNVVKLNPMDPQTIWDVGVFYVVEGMPLQGMESLKRYIELDPEKQSEVYDLCYKMGITPEYILYNLVPHSFRFYRDYLGYLMDSNMLDNAVMAYKRMPKDGMNKDIFLRLCNLLIAKGRYDDAMDVWKDLLKTIRGKTRLANPDGRNLIYNGDLDYDIMNGGFDWRLRKAEGVDVYVDNDIYMAGTRSIGITFDGEHNPDITVMKQIVVVKPQTRYMLKAHIKTDGLTTSNGLFLEVTGIGCNSLDARSEVVTGTNLWKEIGVEFSTPDDCKAVVVAVRRQRSLRFDNKIGGNAWIDGISLTQTDDRG